MKSWVLVVMLGQAVAVGLAAVCVWGLCRGRLIRGGQFLGCICVVLATVLIPLGFLSVTTEPTKPRAPLGSLSGRALVDAMRAGNIAGVYIMNQTFGGQYAVSSVWVLHMRDAGWEQAAIPEGLSTTVGSSFLKSPKVALLTSLPSSVARRLEESTPLKLQDVWWIVFAVALGSGTVGLARSRRLLLVRYDIDEGLRKLLAAGTEH